MSRSIVSRFPVGNSTLRLPGDPSIPLAKSQATISTRFNPASDSFSLSFWLNMLHTGEASDYNYGISIYNQNDNDGGVLGAGTGVSWITSAIGTGLLTLFIGSVSRSLGIVPVINTWYMVTMTYDISTSTLKGYVNNVLMGTFAGIPAFSSCVGTHTIGANRGVVRSMNGYVALPKLFVGSAITLEQVSTLYNTNSSDGIIKKSGSYEFIFHDSGISNQQSINSDINMSFRYGAEITNTIQYPPVRSIVNRSIVSRSVV